MPTGNKGMINHISNMWDVHFSNNKPQKHRKLLVANAIVQKDKSKSDLTNFYHGFLFSPTIATFLNAKSKNHFITWPGINILNFKKLIKDTTNIDLGHLVQERNNLQPTKH